MQRLTFKCQVCGYVYDPAEGEPSQNIPAGTDFENLPDLFECPLCSAGKEAFREDEYL